MSLDSTTKSTGEKLLLLYCAVHLASVYGALTIKKGEIGEGDSTRVQEPSHEDRTTTSWGLCSGEVERHDITNSLHVI